MGKSDTIYWKYMGNILEIYIIVLEYRGKYIGARIYRGRMAHGDSQGTLNYEFGAWVRKLKSGQNKRSLEKGKPENEAQEEGHCGWMAEEETT